MNFSRLIVIVFMILMVPAVVYGHPAPDGFAELTKRLSPAVVNISTSQVIKGEMPRFPEGSAIEKFNDYFGSENRTASSMGSGFVIDPKGIIITNNHVIEDADTVEVTFTDGTVLTANIVGRDPATDLAVLRVFPEQDLPFVSLGNSDEALTGEWVLAIGNPFGLGGSVSAGIISAQNRDISSGNYDQFIQTDAAINRGNSGGPLFNMAGDVIGVNSAILSPSGGSVGVAFSIPSNLVSEIVEQLLTYGFIERGWIGVSVQSVSKAVAQSYGLGIASGALVFSVTVDGPAEKAGIKTGDLIIEFAGKPVENSRVLTALAAKAKPGSAGDVLLIREGKSKTIKVNVDLLKQDNFALDTGVYENESGGTEMVLDMELVVPTAQLRRKYSIRSSVKGLVVLSVREGSDAASKIHVGDVIEQIAWTDVTTVDEAKVRAKAAMAESKRPVLVLVNRRGEALRLAIRP
ncbi:MAG: Do family serine endopeptidase [Robiginitomaculum sp.]|nr:Do family serine endopeptidase [Robiginitomaculum sp.]